MDYISGLLFSNFIITILVIALIVVCTIWISRKKPFTSDRANTIYKRICLVIGFSLAFIPMLVTLGFARGFSTVTMSNKHLILLERGGKGTGSKKRSYSRLFVIDRQTGNKLYRTHFSGRVSLCAAIGDTLLLDNWSMLNFGGNFQLVDARDYKVLMDISEEQLAAKFKELSAGVDRISLNTNQEKEDKSYCLTVNCKNGKTYSYLPFEDKLVEGRFSYGDRVYKTDVRFYFDKEDIVWNVGPGKRKLEYELKAKDNRVSSLYLNDSLLKREAYLDGRFMDFDTLTKELTLLYYISTEKENFKLVRLDSNIKEVWTLDKNMLEAKDFFSSDKDNMDVFTKDQKDYYFNCGGFVVCLDKKSGKIKWKTRL